jgi:putative flippase GtrA
MRGSAWLRQAGRFAAVGLASNAALYLVYLALASGPLGAKSAMTVAYVVGLLATFAVNRRWTFGASGARGPALARYLAVYALGYGLNWIGLHLIVDRGGWPHAGVQAGLIGIVAVVSFLLQRTWVFRSRASASSAVGASA